MVRCCVVGDLFLVIVEYVVYFLGVCIEVGDWYCLGLVVGVY